MRARQNHTDRDGDIIRSDNDGNVQVDWRDDGRRTWHPVIKTGPETIVGPAIY